ncbi:bis(5'-nucleosyl)-tetraphosphatase PrpE [Pullulanibacillus sp. KACC 23026]|uniref:bis(5'-nucleosyl)-tetraphosphatase PrpE n=1 Tax=Pullulanibacillus sp. KACC 23026 TaxID=3028315 RepID=UPI0023AF1361|nr:bis(5'-nucleosyl)-tetraphosphatase PrpE [Pullulanibacillus sp. KACC 23026]WEG15027.1 bis(5'-nucleosyl)-tetraphosphatase PrpE [Pullulanibacillus sp. KACC 23026]
MMFDCIGDIHGCYEECITLLEKLGYKWKDDLPVHPEGRLPVFLGDLTDRGPASVKVMELVSKLFQKNLAKYVPGNHCDKLYRYLIGRNVKINNGLETTVAELKALSHKECRQISHGFKKLYESSPLYLQLDSGQLVVAHAGIKEAFIGITNKKVKSFVLYGDVTGETDDTGFPIRRDWAKHYKGDAWIVYGHTPVKAPRQVGNTINIDTGCVFGGALTAWRYPEKELISVPSLQPLIEEKFRPIGE